MFNHDGHGGLPPGRMLYCMQHHLFWQDDGRLDLGLHNFSLARTGQLPEIALGGNADEHDCGPGKLQSKMICVAW